MPLPDRGSMFRALARMGSGDRAGQIRDWHDWLTAADAWFAAAEPEAAATFLNELPHCVPERLDAPPSAPSAAEIESAETPGPRLAGLWTDTAAARSIYWRRRFGTAVTHHFHGLREGWTRAAEGREADLIQYLAWRREAGINSLIPLLTEHVLDAELPMGLTGTRPVRTAARVVVDVAEMRADLAGEPVPCDAGRYDAVLADALRRADEGSGGADPARNLAHLLYSRLRLLDRLRDTEIPELTAGFAEEHQRVVEQWAAGLWTLMRDGEQGVPAMPDDGDLGARFTLPEFYLPWPTRTSPHLDWLRPRITAWTERMGFFDYEVDGVPVWSKAEFEEVDFSHMVAVTHPGSPPEELELITGLYVIGFYVDDLFARRFNRHPDPQGARRYVARIAACMPAIALPVPPPLLPEPEDPAQRALIDVWRRGSALVSPEVLRDLFDTMKFMFDAFPWEVANIARGQSPDLVDYFETRRQAVGWWHSMAMHRCALSGGLPAAFLDSRPMVDLVCAAGDSVALRNDIISYYREVEREGEVGNAVLILNRFLVHDLHAAVRIVNDLATRRMQHFEDCVARLPRVFDELAVPSGVRAAADAFLSGLRIWMAGELAWELKSVRHAQWTG